MTSFLENLIREENVNKNDISSNIVLKKDLGPIGGDLSQEKLEESIYPRDIFSLIYDIKNIKKEEPFYYALLQKVPSKAQGLILSPWSNETLLHIFTQLIYRKNQIKETLNKEPNIIYANKVIDFNNLLDIDFGYLTNEIYRNEKEVITKAKRQGINYEPKLYKHNKIGPEILNFCLSIQ